MVQPIVLASASMASTTTISTLSGAASSGPMGCTHSGCWPTLCAAALNTSAAPTNSRIHDHGSLRQRRYIIGAQKAATTSVFRMLSRARYACARKPTDAYENFVHCMAVDGKEAHFFDACGNMDSNFDGVNLTKQEALTAYLDGYRSNDCPSVNDVPVFMDATPSYLRDALAPQRMSRLFSVHMPSLQTAARFLVILREPIARDISLYNMLRYEWLEAGKPTFRSGNTFLDLCGVNAASWQGDFPTYNESVACHIDSWSNECGASESSEWTELMSAYDKCGLESPRAIHRRSPNRLTFSMYQPQLETWARSFSRSQMLVLDFGSFLDKQAEYIGLVLKHFGLPANATMEAAGLPRDNNPEFEGKVKHPPCSTRDALQNVFSRWNGALSQSIYASSTTMLASQHHKTSAYPAYQPSFNPFELHDCDDSHSLWEADLQLLRKISGPLDQMQARASGGALQAP